MIYTLADKPEPVLAESCFVADSADLIGWVEVGEESSIWFNTVLRGDNEIIRIGNRSSVQDCSVMHTDPGCPLKVGDGVTIGHSTMLHGCRIGHGSLIGIGSVILNNAVIGERCLVGAKALITENKTFPDNSLILGCPAKLIRQLTDQELAGLQAVARSYVNKIPRYRSLKRIR